MAKKTVPQFRIQDIPEFQRLQHANPQDSTLDSLGAIMMYGRAIHWASILDVIWPDFEKLDYRRIEVAYIATNDPDEDALPESFYQYVASMIAMLWELQLQQKYPSGDWSVTIDDDPEITVEVEIRSRRKF